MIFRQGCSILACVFAWLLFSPGYAAGECKPWRARIISVQGRVEVVRMGKARWRRVKLEETLCAGDSVRIEARSRAAILLANQTILRLDEGSAITFSKIEPDKPSLLELLKGAVHFISRVSRSLEIKTPFVNAGIEGTEFVMRVEASQTEIVVFEGRVRVSNTAGSLVLANDQAAVAEAGKAPVRRIIVKPRKAVQWALYYPPVIDHRIDAYPLGPDHEAIKAALERYRKDDLPGAFAVLGKVLKNQRTTGYYNLSAGLLLTVGRVDNARVAIDKALKLDPRDATAYALRSVIAITQNEHEKALDFARKATDLDPQSPTAQVALSYAYQATFKIEKARDSVKKAVILDSENALAWARLAELELSLGYLDKALAAVQKAKDLDPNVARTQTVLGFANLTLINIEEAKTAFEKAIEFDPAAPLPRLGLGLAMIRKSDLDEGTKELETAAILDPDNSLIRSYLGKAYFEQKRIDLARMEFATAKELDPKDPTPYFYDAILKQTTNRPVEALHDFQQAIELNNNRAVYRSRLLLDQDLAARSSALGRIYNDLGFQQLGLLEGWKSVNTDPSNYSAHRLLADNYAALPRHEIARVSELLQSQLLQPINITPVQPQLAESNLLILKGAGPVDPSFNEFNPLFTRNRLALQASGLAGNNSTIGDEIALSGIWEKFSYSLGQLHYETNGFRENNDLTQDIYNVFTQLRVSPKLSVQAEFRRRELDHGDLFFQFDLDKPFDPNFQRDLRVNVVRAGAHYEPTPHSDFIASVIYLEQEEKQEFTTLGTGSFDSNGYIAEGQYLLKASNFSLIGGGGYFRLNEDTEREIPQVLSASESGITKHSNGYVYSYINSPSQLTWILGASIDVLNDVVFGEFNQVNPKFGIIWSIGSGTTFRAAAFRGLKRSLLTDQTIEPTQVAGFNQFFDDFSATEFKRYGVGLDQRLTSDLNGGLEFTKEDLHQPTGIGEDITMIQEDEQLYRAYLNWAPHPRFAASVEYEFEQFECNAEMCPETRTHIVPATFKYFHPTGIFGSVGVTYVNQKLSYNDQVLPDGRDQFSLIDVGIGYRLPKRYGVVRLAVRNLFDEKFSFQDVGNLRKPGVELLPFLPERVISGQLTLAF
jgi:tetratricopeptide (TPR) repeat protein